MSDQLDPEQWLATGTSTIDDWPADVLRERKRDQRVAVVLPARNEAGTVGDIVAAIIADHSVGPDPLVDEVVVVDSDSRDHTAAVASADAS